MEPRTLPQRFCEAKRAEEERTEHAEACPMRSDTLRDSQKASPGAFGSALEALWTRLGALLRRLGRVFSAIRACRWSF